MGKTIAQKIIAAHLISGDMTAGSEVALRIDQTLTQDATGTMAYLEFETMGIPRVKTELSIAYVDHNWGGAIKTLEYAVKKKLQIINLGGLQV